MCLVTNLNGHFSTKLSYGEREKLVMKKATEDIIVYKVLDKIYGKDFYVSPYRHTRYYLNTHYYQTGKKFTISFNRVFSDTQVRINRGLHAYTSKKYARSCTRNLDKVTVECIIPKGSLYVKGNYHDIVTDNLTVTDKIVTYKRFKNVSYN